jgi:hypothetical protein
LVQFGMQNRTFAPCLTAMHRTGGSGHTRRPWSDARACLRLSTHQAAKLVSRADLFLGMHGEAWEAAAALSGNGRSAALELLPYRWTPDMHLSTRQTCVGGACRSCNGRPVVTAWAPGFLCCMPNRTNVSCRFD